MVGPVSDSVTARRSRPARVLAVLGLGLVVLLVAAALVGTTWSGASLRPDASALAQVTLAPFAGTLTRAEAFAPGGRRIHVRVEDGRIVPISHLAPGERITVDVTIRRPGWLGWALGPTRREQLSITAPVARVADRWPTVAAGAPLLVTFDRPVTAVQYTWHGRAVRVALARPERVVALGELAPTGAVAVQAAVADWERPGASGTVAWFPRTARPFAVTDPAPGASITPTARIRLEFSRPVTTHPTANVPGTWTTLDSHTLQFTPTGDGVALGGELRVTFPTAVDATGPSGAPTTSASTIGWTVPPGSTLRLQQLLAQAGYLPLDWAPSGAPVARTEAAQVAAAVTAPDGSFTWRYGDTPAELQALWSSGEPNPITRGAVMMFENEHNLTVDGIAGENVWRALIADTIAGRRHTAPYSYVYVHRDIPQKLTLWSAGHVVLTSPGNTGVPAAPTQLGTFPVFEHIPVGTMSGTNPDGSRYDDPGIRWISYFNGGDALHSFNRASYGTPQSLGCVELPLAAAARVWPYTPIGTLVTIEN